jgi:hypothetical protein
VEVVSQAVDDGHGSVLGERVHVGLRERPDHDPVHVAGEDDRGVLDRLAAPELEVVRGQVEARAAELGDPDLEAHARARGRLREDHRERPALERPVCDALLRPRLEPVGEVEDGAQLVRRPVVDAEEAPALQMDGDHHGS